MDKKYKWPFNRFAYNPMPKEYGTHLYANDDGGLVKYENALEECERLQEVVNYLNGCVSRHQAFIDHYKLRWDWLTFLNGGVPPKVEVIRSLEDIDED